MNGWQTLLQKEVLRFWKVSFQTVAAPVLYGRAASVWFRPVLEGQVMVYDRIPYRRVSDSWPLGDDEHKLQNAFCLTARPAWCRARSWARWRFVLPTRRCRTGPGSAPICGAAILRNLTGDLGVFGG